MTLTVELPPVLALPTAETLALAVADNVTEMDGEMDGDPDAHSSSRAHGLPEWLHRYGEEHVEALEMFMDARAAAKAGGAEDLGVLARAPDADGRTALGVAGARCLAALRRRLFLCWGLFVWGA